MADSGSFIGELLVSIGAFLIVFLGIPYSYTVTSSAGTETISTATNWTAVDIGVAMVIIGAIFIIAKLKSRSGRTRGR